MNHIQWLCFDPARSSRSAVSKTPSWAVMKRWRSKDGLMPASWPAGRRRGSGSRLLMRREQPRYDVEEDHHGPRQQGQSDDSQSDYRRVDAGVIGETGGDTHDLGVAAVDQETSVHIGFLGLELLHAIVSEVAAETSRSAEMKAPAKIVAVSRTEAIENI